MCVYNAEKYLQESIESILHQTFTDFELIIIDDYSSDNSLSIIKKYQQDDKRIIVLNNHSNLGPARSRNKGLKIAKGEYLAIQDADDISFYNRLEIQYQFLEKNKYVFLCATNAIFINEMGEKIGESNISPYAVEFLPRQNYFIHSSIAMRNDKIYYREKLQPVEDYDLLLRLYCQGKKLVILRDNCLKYRINPAGLTFSKNSLSLLISKEVKIFYNQRLLLDKDNYRQFNPQNISKRNNVVSNTIYFHETVIQILLKNKFYEKANIYFKEHLLLPKTPLKKWLIYRLVTHFPRLSTLLYSLYQNLTRYFQIFRH